MSYNNRYSTLTEAIEDLRKRGYVGNLSVNMNGLLVDGNKPGLKPSEVVLDEFHRFEGETNPDDMSIVYAVHTRSGLKGTVVDSYGADGSQITSEFMDHAEQRQFD